MSPPASGGEKHLLKTFYIYAVGSLIVVAIDLLVLAFSLLTLFRARDLSMRFLVRPGAWLTLRILGVRVAFSGGERIPDEPVVLIGNHLSSYDIFAVCTLGLRRTRYFLSTHTYRYFPLTIIGRCTGTFYIRGQDHPEARTRCFQRASRILRQTGDSVFLTPEGLRVTTGKIGGFNRGAFHLALDLGRPIVPLMIEIPDEVNPGLGVAAAAGTIRITVGEPIDTSAWTLETLPDHIAEVRELYQAWVR